MLNPRFLSDVASYDVANNFCQDPRLRHIDTYFDPSFLNKVNWRYMTRRAISAWPWLKENRRKMVQLGVVQAAKDVAVDIADGGASGSGGGGGREAGTPATKKRKKEPKVGLADIARHVIDTHCEPSFLEFNDILCLGGLYLPDPLPATSSTRICNHWLLS
jgi:hypothetical protein